MSDAELPHPAHFDPDRVGEIWRVAYEDRAREAAAFAAAHGIRPAATDDRRVALLAVDVQNTFCTPGFELFVAGRSGTGAVDDNVRLVRFVYRNLHRITRFFPTMDSHQAAQIFHALFLVDDDGNHPPPMTFVSADDVRRGRWRVNRPLASSLGMDPARADRHLLHYVESLAAGGKYDLTVWPYHAMLGGIGHALVPAVEEAIFFHAVARNAPVSFQVKGGHPLTEHYSVLGPEVETGPDGRPLDVAGGNLADELLAYDVVIVAGQAKSHCVAWTIADLLEQVRSRDDRLARRIYLLEDCTSPVVVAGVADYTDEADAAFRRFAEAGMHVVRSTDPMEDWPGLS